MKKISKKVFNNVKKMVTKYSHSMTFMRQDEKNCDSSILIGQQRCTKCSKIFILGDKQLQEPCYG